MVYLCSLKQMQDNKSFLKGYLVFSPVLLCTSHHIFINLFKLFFYDKALKRNFEIREKPNTIAVSKETVEYTALTQENRLNTVNIPPNKQQWVLDRKSVV